MNTIENVIGLEELDDDQPIARYFARSKLIKLMNTQEIWFCNADVFPDKKERMIPEGFFKGFSVESEAGYKRINTAFMDSIKAYISCWTKFEEDNYALWKIYDKYGKGACLVTTVGKLREAIAKTRQDMILCKVEYINLEDRNTKYDRPWIYYDSKSDLVQMRISEMYKAKQYHYEEEMRGIIYSLEKTNGFGIKVDLKEIIDEVYVSPFSIKKEEEKTVKQLLKRFDESIIKRSTILE